MTTAESFLHYMARQHGLRVRKLDGFGYVCNVPGSQTAFPLGANPATTTVRLLCIAATVSAEVAEA